MSINFPLAISSKRPANSFQTLPGPAPHSLFSDTNKVPKGNEKTDQTSRQPQGKVIDCRSATLVLLLLFFFFFFHHRPFTLLPITDSSSTLHLSFSLCLSSLLQLLFTFTSLILILCVSNSRKGSKAAPFSCGEEERSLRPKSTGSKLHCIRQHRKQQSIVSASSL